jgi:hypothetical protein
MLTWLLVNPAAPSRKPRPMVVTAPTVATFLLAEVPRNFKGMWGDRDNRIKSYLVLLSPR